MNSNNFEELPSTSQDKVPASVQCYHLEEMVRLIDRFRSDKDFDVNERLANELEELFARVPFLKQDSDAIKVSHLGF